MNYILELTDLEFQELRKVIGIQSSWTNSFAMESLRIKIATSLPLELPLTQQQEIERRKQIAQSKVELAELGERLRRFVESLSSISNQ